MTALASNVELHPGESRDIRFSLAWHFPNFYNTDGSIAGHQYENWFNDSLSVTNFLKKTYDDCYRRTKALSDTIYQTSLPVELPDCWSAQLSTLAKATWWTRDGDFAVWEGVGCCGLNTTDIMYQGSFSILALFPQLQKRMMRMNAGVQREDGFVHHVFRGDLKHIDEDGFERVDMNPQFVMLVWRDFLWTGDMEFLRRLWPHVRNAMEAMAGLDRDGDALPDFETKRNTYDAWDFRGASSYISSLAIAAYEAAARIAESLEEKACVRKWRDALRKGAAAMDAKLWNGNYYSLWVDGRDRDECCMADQISGDWFATLMGFGPLLGKERIRKAAQSVLHCNFTPEGGLLNAAYPPDAKPQPSTYLNAQATANWTGIEYAFASMLMEFGMFDEALDIVRSVGRRHLRAGTAWNHIECGEHYYRAMSSWSTLISAAGFKYDAAHKCVTFAPAVKDEVFRAPWFTPSGWGIYSKDARSALILLKGGQLEIQKLRLGGFSGPPGRVMLGGESVKAKAHTSDGALELVFQESITITVESQLNIARR